MDNKIEDLTNNLRSLLLELDNLRDENKRLKHSNKAIILTVKDLHRALYEAIEQARKDNPMGNFYSNALHIELEKILFPESANESK